MTTTPGTADDALSISADQIEIDVDSVRTNVARVLSSDLYWFPVRHHSPTVAKFLQAAIEKRKPKMIFIEGPYEANHLIQHMVDTATRPPVAIYSSYRDDNNVLNLAGIASAAPDIPAMFASWYPLLSYSPEYVAMMLAKKFSLSVTFIDLPNYALIRAHKDSDGDLDPDDEGIAIPDGELINGKSNDTADGDSEDGKSNDTADGDSEDGKFNDTADGESPDVEAGDSKSIDGKLIEEDDPKRPNSESERLMSESGFYQSLSTVAGYRTFNEAWDSLFEIRDFNDDAEFFRKEVATFCAASRHTSNRVQTALDGTVERERHMLKVIRETMQEKNLQPQECMVVCGGFHLFLDENDDVPPPPCPSGTVYTTIVPYSFFRFSEQAGYGAGNRAPQFYQLMWDLRTRGLESNLLIEHVVATLKQARKEGEPLSSADAISTCQHAEMLARLRGRPAPILDDIHDALITCCCKGDPSEVGIHLQKAMIRSDIGTKIGRVTEALGQLPIVNDFYRQISDLTLDECVGDEQLHKQRLDKRTDVDAKKSAFFHRLKWLDIPFATLVDSAGTDFAGGTIFKESWNVRWSPETDADLIEKNLYGDTVEAAALTRFREQMSAQDLHAGAASALLLSAVNMNLPHIVNQVETILSSAIDSDTNFISLAQALANMIVLERYATYRSTNHQKIDELIERCFDRACFAIIDAITVPEEEQQAMVSGLLTLAEIVQRGDRHNLDRNLFIEHVKNAAAATEVAFMRGALLGVLSEMRVLSTDDLAKELSALAKAPVEIMMTAGDFLDGIMAVSRTSIMLGAKALVAAVDELLRASEWEQFLTMVPKMRGAFERLHDAQKDNFADTVAKQYGLKEGESLTELRTSLGAAQIILQIDKRVAEIMSKWDF